MPLKNVFIILLLFFSTIASATDYYISSSGNDSNNGLSSSTAWKTITKVNTIFSTFKPGDRILFNRGDTFYGTINVTASGSAGNPITLGAYGTGANPIITGFTTISGWTNEGSGIYSKSVPCESNPNILTIDRVQFGMGRYPNAGTNLIIDSHSTNVSITDADLNSATTNWTGAEAVIRKNEYVMDRCAITSHSSQTLTYTDSYNGDEATDGYYYFIQNDIRTLDQFGEWYYNGTKLYVYFGADAPTNHVVEVPTLNRLVYIKFYFPYITIDGLSFKGANNEVIYFYAANYGIVKNCDIDFAGGNGIWMESANGLIDNNIINHVNQDGIMLVSSNTNITNTTIKNVGVIEGIGAAGSHTNGIDDQAGGGLIQYNVIDSVGANGIRFGGVGTTGVSIKNNLISNFSLCMNDKGGISTDGDWNNHTFNSEAIIDKNIVLNGIGNKGKSSYDILAQGIYLDSYSSGITVTNNSVANCRGSGLYTSNCNHITLQNNTCYNNQWAMAFLEWGSSDVVLNNTMEDNIFFAKGSTDLTLEFESQSGTIGSFGTADRNYYARPIDDNSTIYTYEGGIPINTFRTLASWQSYTGEDANSHKSPISLTNTNDIRFEYNASKTNKVIVLSQPMIDVKGLKYVNSITLLPFTSVVLMVDPNPAQPVIPIYTSSTVENTTPSLLEINYNASLTNIVPASSAFTVLVNSVPRTVNSIAISGSKVQLTLSSPVVYGNIVSVAYTKPFTNALQTPSGGQAASFTSQTVTNNVAPPTPPIYVSSSIQNATPGLLELVYSLSLANIVPVTSAFTVKVNSVIRTVSSVTISGTKVQLILSSPVVYGDIITVDYTKPSTNPLQTASGGQAASFIAQAVTNNVASITIPIYISSSIENATPSLLVVTYNMTLANLVPAASAFSVNVNSALRAVNTVTVTGTKVQLTLASPVVYGDLVTFSYTKPASNPLQTVSGGQAVSIITQAVTNNVASLTIPAYVSSSIENASPSVLVITYNMTLANLVPAASAFSVNVNSAPRIVNAVAVSGTKVQLTLASPVVYGDLVTFSYTIPASNPLQIASGGQAASFIGQPVTNNVASLTLPVYVSSSIENATPSLLVVTYNMTLANLVPATFAFSVNVNSVLRTVNAVAVSGTKVQLTLSSPVVYGDVVTVSYTKPASNPLQTVSGGQAASFSPQTVTNNVAPPAPPIYVSSAVANATPSILEMTYNMILANIVPAASAFSVHVNSIFRTINSVVISGTKVQLTLASPIISGDVVTITYTKPTINPLQIASGVIAASISNQPVINNCINIAPSVVITSPITNSSYTALANIIITANATDADGSISMVEFYNGSIKIGSMSSAPYSFTWNNVPAGTYSLTVIATDNLNAKTISSAISISVNNGTTSGNQSPVIIISNPQKGNKFENPATITIDAVAYDPDGTISKVEFYSGAAKLFEVTSAPYTYTWKDVKAGTYSITAIATDNLNATTTSLPIEFEVRTTIKYDANSEIINLYPNPNDGHFSIKFINPLQNEKSEIVITDLGGKQVYTGPVTKEEMLKQFDLSNIKPGIYIMMIKDKEILVTKKIIKN